MASCSARSNCGSSPCSPPSGGCARLRSRRCAANLTGLARDCPGNGRSGRRNRRLDRTKEHPPARTTRLPTRSTSGYKHLPSAGKTMNASHTEIPTGPCWPRRAPRSVDIWTSTTANVRIRALTPGRRITPTSPTCGRSRQHVFRRRCWGVTPVGLRPPCVTPQRRHIATKTGSGSTYRRRNTVQTMPATSLRHPHQRTHRIAHRRGFHQLAEIFQKSWILFDQGWTTAAGSSNLIRQGIRRGQVLQTPANRAACDPRRPRRGGDTAVTGRFGLSRRQQAAGPLVQVPFNRREPFANHRCVYHPESLRSTRPRRHLPHRRAWTGDLPRSR